MKCILPTPLVRLVDDDNDFRESQKAFLTALGWQVEDWESPAAFLQDDDLQRPGCAVLDIRMPGMTGLDLQRRFVEAGSCLPVIFLTGHGDVATAVHTMKYGALDFLENEGIRWCWRLPWSVPAKSHLRLRRRQPKLRVIKRPTMR